MEARQTAPPCGLASSACSCHPVSRITTAAEDFGMTKPPFPLAIALALCFIISLAWHPYEGSFLLKASPVLVLAWSLLRRRAWLTDRLFAMGLIFSAGGDIALDIDRSGLFVVGLGSFLVGHIFYTAGFLAYRRSKPRWAIVAVVAIFALLMLVVLWPKLGAMRIPVTLYIIAIVAMASAAAMWRTDDVSAPAGALLFMISDALIACDTFDVLHLPTHFFLIISTYYTAQILIARTALRRR